ncbi:sugar ABC transporter substrate-binding protein [Aquibacillus albus]|uniref:Maltodextrin-binding protein n=1 Tax=Aquibacillus albus TaxID=1168171 RepID=A0ABS2MYE8_9BACI|nr:maltose ABC transporter substrate-binding protein [Aquibacillus albus]MBM7570828.1 arabinogalactan oligomer/maltooligosaccharide transport system substrate-binding protein [Aquibacillus albus]
MKKLLFFLLITSVLIFGLVACGGEEAEDNNEDENAAGEGAAGEDAVEDFEVVPEDGAELLLWSDGDEQLEFSEYIAEKFEEEYGVPVQVEEVNQEEAPGRLATDGPAGLAADVFGSTHDRIGRAISSGLVIENFWPDEYKEAFMDGAIEATSFDGTLYGYPTGIETYALYYNTDLVEEAPETMDELLEVAAGLTEGDTYGFMMEPANLYFQYGLIGANGGYVFGDNNTDVSDIGLNNDGTVKAMETFLRIRDEVTPDMKAEDITYDVRTALFNEGNLAFDINGPWAVPGYEEAPVNFAVAPLPKLENGEEQTSFSGTRAFYVNAYTEYPDAASLLAKFISNEENLLKSYEMTGALPPRLALIDNEVIQEDPFSVAFLEQAANAVPMPNVPEMPLVWDPFHAAVTEIWNNDADIQESLDKAVDTIETAIEEQQQ